MRTPERGQPNPDVLASILDTLDKETSGVLEVFTILTKLRRDGLGAPIDDLKDLEVAGISVEQVVNKLVENKLCYVSSGVLYIDENNAMISSVEN